MFGRMIRTSVKRVVVLSSFPTMINLHKGDWPEHTYTAADWNPITHEEALVNGISGYRGSNKFAERAAWEFMEREEPGFTLTTLNPPFVFGPVVQYPGLSLSALNASNRRFVGFITGALSPTISFAWIDMRDCALGHVRAMKEERTAGERVILSSLEQFCNQDALQIISDEFPRLCKKLTAKGTWARVGYSEGGVYHVDATRAKKLIGKEFVSLRKCVTETFSRIKAFL